MNRLCVLIPVFNNQAGLERTCASLVEAEGEFDVVIVDDGSALPITIPAQLARRRLVLLHRLEENRGITRALNEGLHIAIERGYVFIGRVDSSDTVAPTRFRLQAEHLDSHPRCGIVGSFIQFFHPDGAQLFEYRAPSSHHEIVRRMHSENCLIHSGVMMRASTVAQVGCYRETCLTSEDYDLFLRIIRVSEAAVLPHVLTCCEYNLRGISISRRRMQQRERLSLQLRYFSFSEASSYYGIARTSIAMLVPHSPVLWLKRAFFGFTPRKHAA